MDAVARALRVRAALPQLVDLPDCFEGEAAAGADPICHFWRI